MEILLFFLATIVAAAINALAGGGGLITFSLLLLVMHPVAADATSAIALVTGYPAAVWRTRNELTEAIRTWWLWLLLIPSVLGGLAGALLLSWAGDRDLLELVPWLILGGTLLILLRPILTKHGNSSGVQPDLERRMWPIALVGMFVVALYGGYFGAGIGILVISALGYMGLGDIRRAVAVKNLLTAFMRTTAVLVLIFEGAVNWSIGWPMAVGGLIGGYLGGAFAGRADRATVRKIVIGIGLAVAAYYFWRIYGPPEAHFGGGD